MSTVVAIATSPAAGSGADALLSVVAHRIEHAGHRIVPVLLRDLPAGALIRRDAAEPEVAAAVAAVRGADGVVVIAPTSRSVDGLFEAFVELLPADVLHRKPLLPLATGEQEPTRPPVSSGPAADVGEICFVPHRHLRAYPGGGVVLDAASTLPVAHATDAFLAALGRQVPTPLPRATGRVSPLAGAPDLTVVRAEVDHPVLAPLLRELMIEYSTRYGGPSPYTTLTEVPATDFTGPDGVFLALTQNGETIAGGALRRYDEQTAEVKRVWTSSRHRRRGLARRLMAELEKVAIELGYGRIHLTTGGRQPEAVALYLAAGYSPRFDTTVELGDRGPLAFGKELVPGAGLVEWVNPPTPEEPAVAEREPVAVSAG